ncbi:MAG: hypothetical protein IJP20_03965 [Clostridia bacterium]|nr:hypothetical protein [Clostridia bacterium]
MKRFVSILFVFIFIISAFSVTGVTAFAAEEGGMGEFIGSVQENTSVYMEKLTGLLESLKSYVPMEKIEALKSELTAWVKAIWGFISSNQTYKNIFTAIAAIIVFLLLPIVIGLIVVAYAIMAGMIMFGGALVSVAQVFIEMLIKIGLYFV